MSGATKTVKTCLGYQKYEWVAGAWCPVCLLPEVRKPLLSLYLWRSLRRLRLASTEGREGSTAGSAGDLRR